MAIKDFFAKSPANVTTVTTGTGASIGSNTVRITIDDALVLKNGDKAEVLRLIDAIKMKITKDEWPFI